jgi:hypothetical protein
MMANADLGESIMDAGLLEDDRRAAAADRRTAELLEAIAIALGEPLPTDPTDANVILAKRRLRRLPVPARGLDS